MLTFDQMIAYLNSIAAALTTNAAGEISCSDWHRRRCKATQARRPQGGQESRDEKAGAVQVCQGRPSWTNCRATRMK